MVTNPDGEVVFIRRYVILTITINTDKICSMFYAEEVGSMKWTLSLLVLNLVCLLFLLQFAVSCTPAASNSDIAAMVAEMKTMNQKLASIDAGITAMRGDIATMKGDVAAINGNVDAIAKDVSNIRGSFSGLIPSGTGSSIQDLLKYLPK